jgi:MFS family permease
MKHVAAVGARAWWTLAILVLAAFLSYTDRYVINVLVTEIKRDVHLGDVELSLIQGAAFAMIYAIAGIPLGRLADRLNRRNLVMIGVATWCVGTAACGLATTFAQLFVARVSVGLGEACLFPAAFSMLGDSFSPRKRGTAIGILLMGATLGGGSAVLLGGTLLARMHDSTMLFGLVAVASPWRRVLFTLAALGVPLLLLLWSVSEPPRESRDSGSAGHLPPQGINSIAAEIARLRCILVPLVIGMAAAALAEASLSSWSPAFFVRKFGFDAGSIGLQLGSVTLVAAAAGALVGGWLSDRAANGNIVSARQRIAAKAMGLALPFAMYALLDHPTLSLISFGICLFMLNIAAAAIIAAVQDLAPPHMRGVFAAGQAFIYAIAGLGLGPTAVALTTERLLRDERQLGTSIALISGIALAATVAALWVAQRASSKHGPTLADRPSAAQN